ncbi:MAG TPA: HEAT repeat domain-containing protein [Reyranella sp.]|nr:HEAT repeat domain-containing protein [Reyranella sp.]
MPLVRKPSSPAPPTPPASLTGGTSDERWTAARLAAEEPNGVTLLSGALSKENDPRVREAIFTSLARIATAESAAAVVPYMRSDDATLRAGAIDALRAMPGAAASHLPRLLADPDADVRLLSCELARDLPDEDANRLLCELLEAETEKNVCAAAVEVLAEIGRPEALPSLTRCATRFDGDPFIAFSVKVAIDRIVAPPSSQRE